MREIGNGMRGLASAFAAALAVWGGVARAEPPAGAAHVRSYPAPAGEPLSKEFAVQADGVDVPVYLANVAPGDEVRRSKAMDDVPHSGDYVDHASYAPFDVEPGARVSVTITCPDEVRAARVLPSSYHVEPTIDGKRVTLTLDRPENLTVEVNGEWVRSLHLFASPLEADAPRADDPNVIYFGPGVHEVNQGIYVTSGKTLYLAGGAILRGTGKSGAPVVTLRGDHAALRGRGIIDGSLSPMSHRRNLVFVQGGTNVTIDGVILHDSSVWNLPVRQSDGVTITNLKILGSRANSDGIDICNSSNVTVDGCFLRTLDDLVVIKTEKKGQGPVRHVVVKTCVLWNEVAHAMSVGAELREDVDDVLFADCDVIHDTGREWLLRVYHCDAATVSNVRFENIRVEEARRLMSVWIGKANWSKDAERGHVKDVTFKEIDVAGPPLAPPPPVRVELKGFDATHRVEGVTFDHVVVGGKPLTEGDVKANEFVDGVVVKP